MPAASSGSISGFGVLTVRSFRQVGGTFRFRLAARFTALALALPDLWPHFLLNCLSGSQCFQGRNMQAAGVLVALGLQLRECILQVVDDMNGYLLPSQSLGC